MTQYLSRRRAAARCGRCPKTLRRLQKKGLGPTVIMIGDHPAYDSESLEQWISAGGDV